MILTRAACEPDRTLCCDPTLIWHKLIGPVACSCEDSDEYLDLMFIGPCIIDAAGNHLQHLLWWYILSAFGCCINFCIYAMLRTRDTFSWPTLYKEFRTSDATREFHSKVAITQDLRIYVNVRTTLNIPLTNTECEGFPITHFYLSPFIFFLSYFTLFLSHLCYSFILIMRKEFCNIIMF